MSEALYLFCFGKAGRVGAISTPAGQLVGEVFLHAFDKVVAALGRVSVEDFSGPEAEQNMRDLSWLGPRALEHEAVIDAVMRVSPVLPARFGTLFSSLQALERFVAANGTAITNFLEDLDNKEEWAVKGRLDRAKASAWLLAKLLNHQEKAQSASPGVRYLHERRLRANLDRELSQWLAETCREVAEEASRRAAAWKERQVLPALMPDEQEAVLNLAFLVERDSLSDFRACVEQASLAHGDQGLELELSGPWPPYSFCPALEMPR